MYGTEATGKSAITAALLERLEAAAASPDTDTDTGPNLRHAIINSVECITSRHLFETVVGKAAVALQWDRPPSKCETAAQLTVDLARMLKDTPRPDGFRFVLVFDGIDRQREAPPTLLPALARLSEIVSTADRRLRQCRDRVANRVPLQIPRLTTVFIVTSPPASFLRTSFVPHLHFPNYTKAEYLTILAATPPPPLPNTTAQETSDLWARFTAAVHDALARAALRTLPSLQHASTALWPRFTAPILAGTHAPREFSKLLVAARVHFQDERLLDPGIVAIPGPGPAPAAQPQPQSQSQSESQSQSQNTSINGSPMKRSTSAAPTAPTASAAATMGAAADLAALLPTTARLLLLAAYLASHNATRHDLVLFSTHHHGRRRRRGGLSVGVGRGRRGASKHRKIARKLLGAHAFVLERMMAIFAAVRSEWDAANYDKEITAGAGGGTAAADADVGMAIATLSSLRLLVRVGGAQAGGDPMDRGGKWRVNVGWEVVRRLGRSIGVEVEDWLIE